MMKNLRIILLVFYILLLSTCKKDPELPSGSNKIEFGTSSVDTVSYFISSVTTSVISLGKNAIVQHGHCWGTGENPDLQVRHSSLGVLEEVGSFTSQVDSLLPETKYFVRPYASTTSGTVYGDQFQFITFKAGKPVVSTSAVTDLTLSSARCGGNISNDSGLVITARGVCWSESQTFSLANSLGHTTDGSGTGVFTSSITNLEDGKRYYVSAYATNSAGTSYGEVKSFITTDLNVPQVVTGDINEITVNSAKCAGNVTGAGNGTVSVRGLCYGSMPDPTLDNCLGFTEEAIGLGTFTHTMINLQEGNGYYVTAYATNEEGTGYGEVKSFSTVAVDIPQVTTTNITNITLHSAQSGGEVVSAGNGEVTTRGVCWSTANNPSLSNCLGFTTDGAGLGSYTSSIPSLQSGTLYYVVAYATNEKGTGYGLVLSFTTLAISVPEVTTAAITNITLNSAQCGGVVTSSGNGTVASRGVCWSTNPDPTLQNCLGYTSDGGGTGAFTSNITGLSQGLTYYVKAYAINETGTGYGTQKSFITNNINTPTVTTANVTNITVNSAQSGGEVTGDGNGTITARGVCWSTNPDPTLENNMGFTNDGTGLGSFTSEITGLTEGTTYYVKAYSTNEAGAGYGSAKSFKTIDITLPIVTTATVVNITSTSAQSGGEVTNDGNSAVTARGVCWGTSPGPTLTDSHTQDGDGTGQFTSYLAGLTPNTSYYVRSYATNSLGTAYGNEIDFTTGNNQIPCPGIPTITYEGQVYNTIQIGDQCWLKENLNVGTRINGNLVQTDNSNIEKYCYDNLESNCGIYGGLYMWDELMQYSTQEGATGICPTGWHIPTDEEFTTLSDLLGGLEVAGGKMKESGTIHWSSPNTGASNESGFTGLPGGSHDNDGNFYSLGTDGFFWTSTQSNSTASWERALNYEDEAVFSYSNSKVYGFSVRCLKNSQDPTLPTVTTSIISNITYNSAQGGGEVTSAGNGYVSARGVCWNTTGDPVLGNCDGYTTDGEGLGEFTSFITGLFETTNYYVKAYATNEVGTAYGDEESFTTNSMSWTCGDPITIDHVAGSVAPVNKISSYGTVNNVPGEPDKCWITSNLGANHQATAVDDATEPSAGWYWQFGLAQGYKHDGTTRTPNTAWIYPISFNANWYLSDDPCNLELEDGWRIPTQTEWNNVVSAGNWVNWNGPWNSILKLHAAGWLFVSNGELEYRGSAGHYWSGTQYNADLGKELNFIDSNCDVGNNSKSLGLTLRCIKDL